MSEQDLPEEPVVDGEVIGAEGRSQRQPLDYRAPEASDPQAAEPAPWFGYIGLGIAVAAMLLGFLGMIMAVIWLVGRGVG